VAEKQKILLLVTGSVAAYKALELVRLCKKNNIDVTCVLTKSASAFVTPLSFAALSGNKVYTELLCYDDEVEMGHIKLSRESDAVVVAPATANFIAKMANGICDDLASTICLATDKKVFLAPAMNTKMFEHPATKRNIKTIEDDGITIIEPATGLLACGEEGYGKLAEPEAIFKIVKEYLKNGGVTKPLSGLKALVTSGPTREQFDPVRYISNFSSGKQGYAIAEALHKFGADVTLVSGPTNLRPPVGVKFISTESADDMLQECKKLLPSDIAICAAAVADWKPASTADEKIKKTGTNQIPIFSFTENPDILHELSRNSKSRPKLVIGFAAETEHLVENAMVKMERKNCDWIIANNVKSGKVFGSDKNTVYIITQDDHKKIENKSKQFIAEELAKQIATYFGR
jgi:phosphopantothenoylcysteine decarboxylase / phosphopantothenate---cysteine ligase